MNKMIEQVIVAIIQKKVNSVITIFLLVTISTQPMRLYRPLNDADAIILNYFRARANYYRIKKLNLAGNTINNRLLFNTCNNCTYYFFPLISTPSNRQPLSPFGSTLYWGELGGGEVTTADILPLIIA